MGGPTVPLPPTAPRRRPPCHCQSERSRRRLFARVGSGKRNGLRTRGICFLPQPFFEIPSTNFHDSSRRRRRRLLRQICSRNRDRKSTRLNSSHGYISYAVFCLKKKKIINQLQLYLLCLDPMSIPRNLQLVVIDLTANEYSDTQSHDLYRVLHMQSCLLPRYSSL